MKCINIAFFILMVMICTAVWFTGCSKDVEDAAAVGKIGTESIPKHEESSVLETTVKTPESESGIESVNEAEPEPLTEPELLTEAETGIETEPPTQDVPIQTTKPQSKPAEPELLLPKAERLTSDFMNMLTGLPATKEEYYKRPVAIMINNIKISCPQIGISQAEVIYECLVEGGMTRLLMLMLNYENASEIGSVRSSREYYLDFAANHNAIYVHAGGSNTAYEEIRDRRINNLDGVNMYLPDAFYRDEWRKINMGYEHSLMITGPKIAASIKYKKYDTVIKDTFNPSFNFVDHNEKIEMTGGSEARHVIITYNNSHFPQYIYNSKTNTYKRYQFNGVAHIDGATGTQLEFTNVLILNLPHEYTGDSYGHVNVNSVGSGKGYYISAGRSIPIFWNKKSKDIPMVLTKTDGNPLLMNCGKTFVNIVNNSVYDSLCLNYRKS